MRALRLALGAVVAVVASIGWAAPAGAHAALLESTPPDRTVLQVAPGSVALRFSERVTTSLGAVRVLAPDGERVDAGSVTTRANGAEVVADLKISAGEAGHGTYSVLWRVVSQDSHPVSGTFSFSVGHPSAASSAAAASEPGDGVARRLLTIGRGVLLGGLLLLVGGVCFLAGLWPSGWERRGARRIPWVGFGMVGVGSLAVLLLQGPYAAGLPVSRMFDTALLRDVAGTRLGTATLVRLVLLVPAALLLRGRPTGPTWRSWSFAVAAVGLLVTTSVAGHAGVGSGAPLAVAADVAHLAAVAIWVGGLVVLAVVLLRHGTDDDLTGTLPRWSRVAAWSVAVMVATGLFASWREVREVAALGSTSYGRLLILKTALVAVMVALGALGRRWVRRRIESGGAARLLRRGVVAESVLAVVVVVVTAVLVETTPARNAYAPLFTAVQTVDAPLRVQVDIEPARAGVNQLHVYYTGQGGKAVDVEEVTARFVHDDTRDAVPVDVRHATLGHYEQLTVPLPQSGRWRLQLTTRTSDIDATTTVFTFRVR